MKSTKSTDSKTEAETGQLVLRAVVARKQAELARKQARRAKVQYKAARKAFKKAKKIAREARKLAKAATKAFVPSRQTAARTTKKKSPAGRQSKVETKKPKSITPFPVSSKSDASPLTNPTSPSIVLPEPPQAGATPGLAQ